LSASPISAHGSGEFLPRQLRAVGDMELPALRDDASPTRTWRARVQLTLVVASRLLLMLRDRVDASDRKRMAAYPTGWLADDSTMASERQADVTLRVRRQVDGRSQVLFMFAGKVDLATLRAVLQHVRRLTHAVHGQWRVEMVASGVDAALLHDIREALRNMRRACVAQTPMPSTLHPELRALIARPALLPS